MSAGQSLEANINSAIELEPAAAEKLLDRKDMLFCCGYAALITIAEIIVGYGNIIIGMLVHAILLVAILAHSSLAGRDQSSKMLLTLALAPLTRMLSLAMPLGGIPIYYWYAVIGLPLILATVTVARINGYKARDLGINTAKIPLQLLFGLVGVGLGYIEYLILRPQPIIAPLTWTNILIPALVLIIFTGFMEELAFRGVMQKAFSEGISQKFSIIFVSYIFAVLHITHLSVLDIFFVFGVALLFTYALKRLGSLLGITLAHGLTNIFLYAVWPNFY